MPDARTAAIILFWAELVSGLAAAIWVGQWMWHHARRIAGGDMTTFPMKYPGLVLLFCSFSMLCGIAGLWLLFHLPKPVQCPDPPKCTPPAIVQPSAPVPQVEQKPSSPKRTPTATHESPAKTSDHPDVTAPGTKGHRKVSSPNFTIFTLNNGWFEDNHGNARGIEWMRPRTHASSWTELHLSEIRALPSAPMSLKVDET